MRFIFYFFVFSQLFNLLDVLAEKIKKDPSEQKIKWERVKDGRSNNLKKIIWKSYNNDESYFKKEIPSFEENNSDKNLFNTKKKIINL